MPLALLLALAASLCLHIGALVLPDLELPGLGEAPAAPPLDARLAPLQPHAPPPAAAAAPKPAAKAKAPASAAAPPSPQQALPATPPAPASSAEVAATAAEATPPTTGANDEEAPAPINPGLPLRGRIRFAVFKGEQNLEVGQSIHEWQVSDGHYRLTGSTETTGLAALIRAVKVGYESRGKIGPAGLQPETFVASKNGVATSDRADFDWSGGSVTLGREQQHLSLPAGTQDFISFYYALGYLPQIGAAVDIPVVTGRKLEILHFTRVSEETLNLAIGPVPTVHLKAAGETTTEVWLARNMRMLPVKIRHIDKKGELFDQIATELQAGAE